MMSQHKRKNFKTLLFYCYTYKLKFLYVKLNFFLIQLINVELIYNILIHKYICYIVEYFYLLKNKYLLNLINEVTKR